MSDDTEQDSAFAPTELQRGTSTQRLAANVRARLFDGAPAVPPKIGRFDVERVLGQGGMGVVYLGRDARLDRPVALKLLHDADDDGRGTSLEAEAQAMARLSHPNVAHVYEVGEHEGRPYVAMEYVDGPTLRAWQQRDAPSPEEILERFVQAGRGLAAAHARGLVHRDFKPDNALIGSDGRVRVVDFGLAREAVRQVTGDDRVDDGLRTRVAGTPGYMAPEQLCGLKATAATDQFAFCVALWEALLGERPFKSATAAGLLERIEAGAPAAAEALPPGVRAPIVRGLSAAAAERFATMDELLAALEPRRTRRRWPWLAAGGIALVAAAAWWPGSPAVPRGETPAPEAPVPDEDAAIVAASELPPEVPSPLADDPWEVTVHRLSNGLTVYISPERSQPRVLAGVVIRAGRREAGEHVLAPTLVQTAIENGSGRVGALQPTPPQARARIDALLREISTASSDEERDALVREIDSVERELASTRNWREPQQLEAQLELRGVLRSTTDDGIFDAHLMATNRFPAWAALTAERLQGPPARMHVSDLARIAQARQELAADPEVVAWRTLLARMSSETERREIPELDPDTIRTIDWDAVERFRETWVVPNNVAIAVVGDIDRKTALQVLEESFGGWRPRPLPQLHREVPRPATPDDRLEVVGSKPSVELAWPVPPQEARRPGLKLLVGSAEQAVDERSSSAVAWSYASYDDDARGSTFVLRAGATHDSDEALTAAEAALRQAVARLAGEIPAGAARLARTLEMRSETRGDALGRLHRLLHGFAQRQSWSSYIDERKRRHLATDADLADAARFIAGTEPYVTWLRRGSLTPPEFWIPHPEPEPVVEGTSDFARELLARRAAPQEPRFWSPNRHYKTQGGHDDAIVTAANATNDYADIRIGFHRVPAAPDDCVVAAAIPDLVVDGQRLSELARGRAVQLEVLCDPVATLLIGGPPEDALAVFDRLRAAVAAPSWGDGWPAARRSMAARSERLTPPTPGSRAHPWACSRTPHPVADSRAVERLTHADAAMKVTELVHRPRWVGYFGPEHDERMDQLALAPVLGDPSPLPPPQCEYAPGIHVVDVKDTAVTHIYIRSVTPAPPENPDAIAALLSAHLADPTVGVLTTELASLSAAAGPWQGERVAELGLANARRAQPELYVELHSTHERAVPTLRRALAALRSPITPARFETLRPIVDARIRMRIDEPSDLPFVVANRRLYGYDHDTGQPTWDQLPGTTAEQLASYAEQVAEVPPAIIVVGDLSRIGRDALRELGPVSDVGDQVEARVGR